MADLVLRLISQRRCIVHRLPVLKLSVHLVHLTSLKHIESLRKSGNDRKRWNLLKVLQKSGRELITTTTEAAIELKPGVKK